MALIGFILAFIISITGLVLSILAFCKSKKLEGEGRGLSLAGIVISAISLAVLLTLLLVIVILVQTELLY